LTKAPPVLRSDLSISNFSSSSRAFRAERWAASCSQLKNTYWPGSANTVNGLSSADVHAAKNVGKINAATDTTRMSPSGHRLTNAAQKYRRKTQPAAAREPG